MFELDIERDFLPDEYVKFAANNWGLVIAILIIYLMGIKIGQTAIAKREKAFDLKYPLVAWNTFLCVFSFCGMCRTVRLVILLGLGALFRLFTFPYFVHFAYRSLDS
jgi:hypothetical protein